MDCLESVQDHAFQTAFDATVMSARTRFMRPSWFWKLQRWLGVGIEGELQRNLAVINRTVLAIVKKALDQRRSSSCSNNQPVTLISLFLDYASESDDDADSASALRDTVINFLAAARDTTAQTLSWLFYRLDQSPGVAEKIRQEIATKIPDTELLAPASIRQVSDLVYLEAVQKETLRFHPAGPLVSKHVAQDIVLSDGTSLRANSVASLFTFGMGRLESVWGADAAQFKPERWVDTDTGKLVQVSAFQFPAFNAGPRLCLGVGLAMLEMKLLVVGLLTRFELTLEPDQPVTYAVSITLPMKNALLARITRRLEARQTPSQH